MAVSVGDRKTTIKMDMAVMVPVSFSNDKGEAEEAITIFIVMPSTGHDLGMPLQPTDFERIFLAMSMEASR
jgi:hypothetical protein